MYFRKSSCLTLLLLFSILSLSAQVASITPPKEQFWQTFGEQDKVSFLKPEKVYYPETWFHFIGGNVSKAGITADLEAIAAAGTSGITLFHGQFGGLWPGVDTPITCLSPLWEDAVRHAAQECRRLGLRFAMEDCPGWAMAGGPWIKPAEAMRQLVWSRKDVEGGKGEISMQLAMPDPSSEPWRDYKDIAVLAFPRPLGDTGDTLKVTAVRSNMDSSLAGLLLDKSSASVSIKPATTEKPNWFEVDFPSEVVVRTIQLPDVNDLNTRWAYEPAVTIRVVAVGNDGQTVEVLNRPLPASNFQDHIPLTLAFLKDVPTKKLQVYISNRHSVNLDFVHFFSAARENNWEANAGWVLRSVGRSGEKYSQDRQAYVDPAQIRDITAFVNQQGMLEWTPPAGNWTILRIGHVNAGKQNGPAPPEGTGWECDKLSSDGANAQFAGYIGHLSGNNGPLKNGLLSGMLMDSWECETQTWTGNMENEFRQRTGYSLRQWLPALLGYVVQDQETSFRFLHDWKSVINDLFTNNFYGRMAALARQNNLSIAYETAAGDVFPADILEYWKFADVPMCEFWQPLEEGFVGSLNFKPIKPCASAARLYGKPRVAAEAFTSFHLTWDEHWQALKEVANINMVEGVTHLVYHTYTHNPQVGFLPPGTSFGSSIGTPFLRGQTWWKHMPYLNVYFARCSYLLERGLPVSDVLWYLGDEIDHKPDQQAPFPAGYKYDYCNPDVLLNRLTVINGMLTTPEGIQYKVLWLPQTTHMLPGTLEKIDSLLRGGAIVVGDAPVYPVTLAGGIGMQRRFDAAVRHIWGSRSAAGPRRVGKGMILSGMELSAALKELRLYPDVIGDSALWVHRKVEGADWYFVSSPKGKSFKGKLAFRNSGTAEIWDPVTGSSEPVAVDLKNGRSEVAFDLPQAGSCFVVFRRNGGDTARPRAKKIDALHNVDDNWTLAFPPGWNAPASLRLKTLQAWKDLDLSAEGKAFSGTAAYSNEFTLAEGTTGNRYLLDLGTVNMIAKVFINGKAVGTAWAEPYVLDITDAVVAGKNKIRVEVTSTWFNRLVYDAGQPDSNRKTWTISGPSKDAALRGSGLLGPVAILTEHN